MTKRNSVPVVGGELTLGQEALWLIQNLDPDCVAYNVTAALSLHFPVDVASMESAVRSTVLEHTLLGSVFGCDDAGRVRRHPASAAAAAGLFERYEPDLDEDGLRAFALGLTRRPFGLDREPPVRVALLRPRGGSDILLITAHHIVADNISQLLICQEILSRYAALRAGGEHVPQDAGAVFDRFVRRQRAYLDSPRADRARRHWQRELQGVSEHTALPADLPRPAVYRPQGAEIDLVLPPDLVAALDDAVAARNVTVFAYLLTVFELLVHRFSGQSAFVVGYPVTQRQGVGTRDAIGYFVNTLALRVEIDPEEGFDALLRGTAAGLWRSLMHRDFPFALLSGLVDLPRDPGRPGPVTVLFALNDLDEDDPIAAAMEPGRTVEHAGLRTSEYYLPQQQGQFELALQMTRRARSVQAKLKYNTSLFTERTARQLAQEYLELLRSAVGDTLPPALRELIPRSESGSMDSTRTDTDRAARLARIRDVAAEVFSAEPAAVEAAEDFEKDLDTDSLLAVEFVVELERVFGVPLHVDQIPRLMAGLDSAYETVAESAGW
ncbi:condensation domain-containing protein [Streptomyces sp. NPDC006288]|uniref:condensation domain-containing protein n=1 Tax=Streptomyces sp. NPDC006288 TaxID=3156743 RepID=UPI0033AB630C